MEQSKIEGAEYLDPLITEANIRGYRLLDGPIGLDMKHVFTHGESGIIFSQTARKLLDFGFPVVAPAIKISDVDEDDLICSIPEKAQKMGFQLLDKLDLSKPEASGAFLHLESGVILLESPRALMTRGFPEIPSEKMTDEERSSSSLAASMIRDTKKSRSAMEAGR